MTGYAHEWVVLENVHATCYFQAKETRRAEMAGIHDNDWDETEAARGRSVQITCLFPSYLTSSTPMSPHPFPRSANCAAPRGQRRPNHGMYEFRRKESENILLDIKRR